MQGNHFADGLLFSDRSAKAYSDAAPEYGDVKDETGALQYPEGQDASTSTYMGWFNWPFVREQFMKPSGKITQEALDEEKAWLQKDNLMQKNVGLDKIMTYLQEQTDEYVAK